MTPTLLQIAGPVLMSVAGYLLAWRIHGQPGGAPVPAAPSVPGNHPIVNAVLSSPTFLKVLQQAEQAVEAEVATLAQNAAARLLPPAPSAAPPAPVSPAK